MQVSRVAVRWQDDRQAGGCGRSPGARAPFARL